MTEYEQKVTRTLYWLTAASHRDALLSSSRGGTRMDWWPEYTLKPETYMQAERLSGTTLRQKAASGNNTMFGKGDDCLLCTLVLGAPGKREGNPGTPKYKYI